MSNITLCQNLIVQEVQNNFISEVQSDVHNYEYSPQPLYSFQSYDPIKEKLALSYGINLDFILNNKIIDQLPYTIDSANGLASLLTLGILKQFKSAQSQHLYTNLINNPSVNLLTQILFWYLYMVMIRVPNFANLLKSRVSEMMVNPKLPNILRVKKHFDFRKESIISIIDNLNSEICQKDIENIIILRTWIQEQIIIIKTIIKNFQEDLLTTIYYAMTYVCHSNMFNKFHLHQELQKSNKFILGCYHAAQFELLGIVQTDLQIKLSISSIFSQNSFFQYLPSEINQIGQIHQKISQYVQIQKKEPFEQIYQSFGDIPKSPKKKSIDGILFQRSVSKHNIKCDKKNEHHSSKQVIQVSSKPLNKLEIKNYFIGSIQSASVQSTKQKTNLQGIQNYFQNYKDQQKKKQSSINQFKQSKRSFEIPSSQNKPLYNELISGMKNQKKSLDNNHQKPNSSPQTYTAIKLLRKKIKVIKCNLKEEKQDIEQDKIKEQEACLNEKIFFRSPVKSQISWNEDYVYKSQKSGDFRTSDKSLNTNMMFDGIRFPVVQVDYYENGQKMDLNGENNKDVRKIKSTRDYRMKLRPQILEIEKDINNIRKNNFLHDLTSLLK